MFHIPLPFPLISTNSCEDLAKLIQLTVTGTTVPQFCFALEILNQATLQHCETKLQQYNLTQKH